MITIEIDDKKVEVESGKMIIQVTDELGVYIPRFCYHKKLSIASNCRMCLVDVESVSKPLPACCTPVTDGMKVYTHSAKAHDAQRAVMEFLLINHPLDCPICDQGGECELQDLAMGYGRGISSYTEGKRSIHDENLGSLIATDMTRCILCTRCVRFGEEIAGIRELGLIGRGEKTQISTAIERSMQSELSGNIIDLCPVGALTSKPFRFRARAWELQQADSIAPHDCLGSHIHVHTRQGEVMRVVAKANEAINEIWLSDRDRFSYLGLNHPDRIGKPRIKRNGQWQETDWGKALHFALTNLKSIINEKGADQIGALISPNATIEEAYLSQKLLRALGSHHIDHRLRESDVSDQTHAPSFPGLPIAISDLEKQQTILVVGANVWREQPLVGHRIRQATLKGAAAMAINCIDDETHFDWHEKTIVSPAQLIDEVAGVAKALLTSTSNDIPAGAPELLKEVHISSKAQAIANRLQTHKPAIVLLGATAQHHSNAATLRSLTQLIAHLSDSHVGMLTDGCNGAGAWLAGAVPHRVAGGKAVSIPTPGYDAYTALTKGLSAYVLLGVEPEIDSINPQAARRSLDAADLVICLTPFTNTAMLQYADVILPIAAFTELSGTYVNATGQWQSVVACAKPYQEARPAWKILRVLGNLFELPGFDYQSSTDVLAEIKKQIDDTDITCKPTQWFCPSEFLKPHLSSSLQRITEWAIYSIDPLVRRAEALQDSAAQEKPCLKINTALAEALQLEEGEEVRVTQDTQEDESEACLIVAIDDRVPDHCVLTYAGFSQMANLGNGFGRVVINKKHAS